MAVQVPCPTGDNKPAQQRHQHQRGQTPAAFDKGGEDIAAALERGETHAGCAAENDAVDLGIVAVVAGDDDDAQDLGEFLDQARPRTPIETSAGE